MTLVLNAPPPPTPPAPSPVVDRVWLGKADKSIRVLRIVILILAPLAICYSILIYSVHSRLYVEGIEQAPSRALLTIPWTLLIVVVSEVATIAVRSIIAAAWVLRKPDDQP